MKFLFVAAVLIASSVSAQAEVTVRPRAVKYGALMVVGKPSLGSYGRMNDTFNYHIVTTGTRSEDSGSWNYSNPINKVIKLRVGTYMLDFSNSYMQVVVQEGQVTKANLVKVKAAPMDGTKIVNLYNSDFTGEDDYSVRNGYWSRTDQEVTGRNCQLRLSLFIPYNSCQNTYRTVTRPWSTAVFYVFPGKYTMSWELNDGTTHTQSDITVQ